jgi:hypothetical protein
VKQLGQSLQAAFLTYGAMEPGTASLMAELLVRHHCMYSIVASVCLTVCIAARSSDQGTAGIQGLLFAVQGFDPDLVLPQLEMYTRDK